MQFHPHKKKKGTGAPNQRAAATVEEMEPGVYGEALKVCWKKMGWWHDPPTYGWRMNRLSTQMAGRWKVWQFADGNIKLVGGFNPSEKYYCSQIISFPQVGVKIKGLPC